MTKSQSQNPPAAACPLCGGWTSFGGMSHHHKSTEPVIGRMGCTCFTNGSMRHPEIHVQLTGTDGNAFALIGKVLSAMKREGVPETHINSFLNATTNADSYDSLLSILTQWVHVS